MQLKDEYLSGLDIKTPEGFAEYARRMEEIIALWKELGLVSATQQNNLNEIAKTLGQGMGTVFENFGAQWMETVGLMDEGANKIQQTLAKLVIKAMAMLLSNAISYAIAGASQASFWSGPAAPFTLPAFIAEMVGVVTGAFASVPKFKDGAVVDAPTLGIFGEYPGAKSNPEVVAPLDKLKNIIGGGNDVSEVYVYGQLAGDNIYITNERFSRKKALVQ